MLVYLAMIDSPQDKDKFQKLYDLYEGLLYHIAWNILHNRQDVEDAVQQTFLKILTHLEKIVQVDCPQTRSYVSIVCRYACLDLVNKRGRAREVPLDDLDELALQDHIREDFLLDAFGKLGFLDETFHAIMDVEWLIRNYEGGTKIMLLDRPLGAIRVYEETKTAMGGHIWKDDRAKLQQMYGGRYYRDPLVHNKYRCLFYAYKYLRGCYLKNWLWERRYKGRSYKEVCIGKN